MVSPRSARGRPPRALTLAAREYERVVGVFVLDDALLRGRFASGPRTAFMLGCLRALDAALRERGSGLVVRHGRPEAELCALAADCGAEAVLWTSDVAAYARARDARVSGALRDEGIRARPQGGAYVVDVSLPRTKAGGPFTVFGPFHRHWLDLPRRTVHRAPAELPRLPGSVRNGRLESLDALGLGEQVALAEPHCQPGKEAARDALTRWLDGPIDA